MHLIYSEIYFFYTYHLVDKNCCTLVLKSPYSFRIGAPTYRCAQGPHIVKSGPEYKCTLLKPVLYSDEFYSTSNNQWAYQHLIYISKEHISFNLKLLLM